MAHTGYGSCEIVQCSRRRRPLWVGYRDLGDYHPIALLLPASATAVGSALVGVVLVSRRPLRRFGAGVLGGVLFALVVEFGLLALYVGQIIAD